MNLQKDLDEIKNEVREEIKNETSETMSPAPLVEQPLTSNSFEDAKNQALAEFKPKYDTNKTMYENGKDIARTIGLNEALKDNKFLNEMKEGAQREIRTDIDTDQKDAEIRNQEKFYKKHLPVLLFARMKEPSGLSLMKWTYAFAVVPYMISLIIGGLFSLIAMIFSSLNDLFNTIVGSPEYYTNNQGELILDKNGKPITKTVKVNLLTKILFWFLFVVGSILIIFAVIKGLTGFDIIGELKNLVRG